MVTCHQMTSDQLSSYFLFGKSNLVLAEGLVGRQFVGNRNDETLKMSELVTIFHFCFGPQNPNAPLLGVPA